MQYPLDNAPNHSKVKELVSSGNLRLILECSAPRNNSNIIARMFEQSPDVHGIARSKFMNQNPDDTEKFWGDVLSIHDAHGNTQGRKEPFGILLKEHAFFVTDKLWKQFSEPLGKNGKTLVDASIFTYRDPFLHAASEVVAIAKDPDIIPNALSSKRGIDREGALQAMDAYAQENGHSNWNDLVSKMSLALKAHQSDDLRPLNGIFNEIFASPESRQWSDYPNGVAFYNANPFTVGKGSWQQMASYLRQKQAGKTVVLDATAMQADTSLGLQACDNLGITPDEKMIGGNWEKSGVGYGSSVWSADAAKSTEMRPPTNQTVKRESLPDIAQAGLDEKLEAYVLGLSDKHRIGMHTEQELRDFFGMNVDSKAKETTNLSDPSSLLHRNPIACYALASTARGISPHTRSELLQTVRSARPDFTDEFKKIDMIRTRSHQSQPLGRS